MIPSADFPGPCALHEASAGCCRLIAVAVALSGLAATSLPLSAHDAPSGWTYDMACCGNHECRLEQSEVRATRLGWLVTSTGEIIRYGDSRIHASKDGEFHRCLMRRGVNGPGMMRCLYVPPMSQ